MNHSRRERSLDEFDAFLEEQRQRIHRKLRKSTERIDKANKDTRETGPLVRPQSSAYAFSGDDIDVESK